jgi:ABC-type iron transport system FetAB permease component
MKHDWTKVFLWFGAVFGLVQTAQVGYDLGYIFSRHHYGSDIILCVLIFIWAAATRFVAFQALPEKYRSK